MNNNHSNCKWSVAIFGSRESVADLQITLEAVLSAIGNKQAQINLLINGNEQLAISYTAAIANYQINNPAVKICVWFIAFGDKAHAWNQYLQSIWNDGEMAFFVDGYTRPNPDAFALLDESLHTEKSVFAATGLPTTGRTASALRKLLQNTHGLHGNLYCVKSEVMQYMKATGFHLPLGIYRTDPALGAAIKFSFDPGNHDWDINRIYVHPDVSWTTPPKYWWRLSDVKGQVKRIIRQAQGDLENKALRFHLQVCKRPANDLPLNVLVLVESWISNCSQEASMLLKNPLRRYALKKMRKSHFGDDVLQSPVLVYVKASNNA